MIKLSPRAKTILDAIHHRYASQTYQRFYGKSPFRNWQIMFDRELCSLEYDSRTGIGLRHTTEWGDVIYSCAQHKGNVIIIIDNFFFNYRPLHKWFTKAEYPSITITRSNPQTYNSFSFIRPFRNTVTADGNKVYAVQSDTNLYSLADKNKNLVIDKWFNSLTFPINQTIGNLQIIGHGTINRIPYYIDSNLKLHHGAEIAQMQRPKMEGRRYRKNIIRLNESLFRKMLVECISKIIKKIS